MFCVAKSPYFNKLVKKQTKDIFTNIISSKLNDDQKIILKKSQELGGPNYEALQIIKILATVMEEKRLIIFETDVDIHNYKFFFERFLNYLAQTDTFKKIFLKENFIKECSKNDFDFLCNIFIYFFAPAAFEENCGRKLEIVIEKAIPIFLELHKQKIPHSLNEYRFIISKYILYFPLKMQKKIIEFLVKYDPKILDEFRDEFPEEKTKLILLAKLANENEKVSDLIVRMSCELSINATTFLFFVKLEMKKIDLENIDYFNFIETGWYEIFDKWKGFEQALVILLKTKLEKKVISKYDPKCLQNLYDKILRNVQNNNSTTLEEDEEDLEEKDLKKIAERIFILFCCGKITRGQALKLSQNKFNSVDNIPFIEKRGISFSAKFNDHNIIKEDEFQVEEIPIFGIYPLTGTEKSLKKTKEENEAILKSKQKPDQTSNKSQTIGIKNESLEKIETELTSRQLAANFVYTKKLKTKIKKDLENLSEKKLFSDEHIIPKVKEINDVIEIIGLSIFIAYLPDEKISRRDSKNIHDLLMNASKNYFSKNRQELSEWKEKILEIIKNPDSEATEIKKKLIEIHSHYLQKINPNIHIFIIFRWAVILADSLLDFLKGLQTREQIFNKTEFKNLTPFLKKDSNERDIFDPVLN